MSIFPAMVRIRHFLRYVSQRIVKVKIGVIGGYHGVNLGDIALGTAVANVISVKGYTTGLQTIYNLEKWNWPKAPYAIAGGGAQGYDESLRKIAKRYNNEFDKVALLGVDFNEETYNNDSLNLMTKAAWVSCRSEAQAKHVAQLTGRNDISFHPDLAFSLLQKYCEKNRESQTSKTEKKFLINIVPLYGHVKEGKLLAAKQYESERPELYASFNLMHASYKSVVRKAIAEALAAGYSVETLPFTPMDEAFGKLILEGLNVHHGRYHADVNRMFKKIGEAEWVFATRYHATIFALKMGVKITPIAYAKKNELLLEELGVKREDYLTTDDLAIGKQALLKCITVSSEKISVLELMSTSAINKCIDTLNVK